MRRILILVEQLHLRDGFYYIIAKIVQLLNLISYGIDYIHSIIQISGIYPEIV